MSYDMDHEEFEAATGLKNRSPVTVKWPTGEVVKGRLHYFWVGPGWDWIKVKLRRDARWPPSITRSYPYVQVHDECNGPYPFNYIMDGVVIIDEFGHVWDEGVTERARMLRRRAELAAGLSGWPERKKAIQKEIAALTEKLGG